MYGFSVFIFFTILALVPAEEIYSFQKFSGPVSGKAQQISVTGHHHQEPKIDFIAKPDYSFHYGVQDGEVGNSHVHQESRDGDEVRGEYRVLQSDGIVRIVKYTADADTGFQATVEYAPLSS